MPNSVHTKAQFDSLMAELQTAIPDVNPTKGAAASLGGNIGLILALVAALRSGDVEAIKAAALALLNVILAPKVAGAQSALFGGGHKIDWSKILVVIEKLLPILIGIAGV